jgi:hypothetical protein
LKKLIGLATAVTVVLLLPAFAAAQEGRNDTPIFRGTITVWDDATKQATVKDFAGKETTFGWDDKTTVTGVTGTPKVGNLATVSYTTDKDGKTRATHIEIGIVARL